MTVIVLAGAVTAAGAAGMALVVRDVLRDALAGAPLAPADALVGVLAAVAALGLAWLALGVALEALSRVPGAVGRMARSASAALSPRVVRRVAGIVLGVGLGVGGGGAHATSPLVAVARHGVAAVVAAPGALATGTTGAGVAPALPDPGWGATPDPGWVPERPTVRPQPDLVSLGSRPAPRDAGSAEVVVRRGDSLWSIAGRHLGAGATDTEIAAAWPRWYAANRDVVGPDPDVLLPGQVLRVPSDVAAGS